MSTGTATETLAPATNVNVNDPWSMEVANGGGSGEYVLCPPGNGPGVVVGIFDTGHQTVPKRTGGTMEQRKLVLVFELAKKRPDGKPFVMAERYTWSMNDQSHFFALVTNLTGKKYKEGERFNPLSLLGLPAMVSITNSPVGEKTYHNVGTVAQFPEGFPAPTATYKPIAWSVMTGEAFPAGLDHLPYVYGKSIESLAKESTEFKARAATVAPPSQNPDIPF